METWRSLKTFWKHCMCKFCSLMIFAFWWELALCIPVFHFPFDHSSSPNMTGWLTSDVRDVESAGTQQIASYYLKQPENNCVSLSYLRRSISPLGIIHPLLNQYRQVCQLFFFRGICVHFDLTMTIWFYWSHWNHRIFVLLFLPILINRNTFTSREREVDKNI